MCGAAPDRWPGHHRPVDIPVRCKRCGLRGTTPNLIGGDNVTNLTLEGVTVVGGCPRCGGDLEAVPGTYSFSRGVMTAFRALDASNLGRVEAILRDSRSGGVTADQATEQVAAVAPELRALVEQLRQQRGWSSSTIVLVLLAVLAIVVPLVTKGDSLTEHDNEAIQHDIEQAIERVVPTEPLNPPAGTRVRTPEPRSGSVRRKRPPKRHGQGKRRRRRR